MISPLESLAINPWSLGENVLRPGRTHSSHSAVFHMQEIYFPNGGNNQAPATRLFSFSSLRFFFSLLAKTKRKRNEGEGRTTYQTSGKSGIQPSTKKETLTPFAGVDPALKPRDDRDAQKTGRHQCRRYPVKKTSQIERSKKSSLSIRNHFKSNGFEFSQLFILHFSLFIPHQAGALHVR